MDKIALLKTAYVYAAANSTDKSTQNGALLINDNGQILLYAANHFPTGVIETPDRWLRPTKYLFIEHAERNLIFKAAKAGIATNGLTMIACWAACADCGRAIIQAGIKRVITHKFAEHDDPMWKESITIADQMFHEAGVEIERVEGEIGIEILFSGKLVKR